MERRIVFSQSDEQGLLLCWNLCSSSPELKPNKITVDEGKNKSRIELRLTRTTADSEQKDEDLFVSQHSSKPNPMFTIQ